jgi:hypothetical protein
LQPYFYPSAIAIVTEFDAAGAVDIDVPSANVILFPEVI